MLHLVLLIQCFGLDYSCRTSQARRKKGWERSLNGRFLFPADVAEFRRLFLRWSALICGRLFLCVLQILISAVNWTGILGVMHVPLWRGFRGEVKADFFVNIKYEIFFRVIICPLLAAPAKAKERWGRDSEQMIFVSRRCRRIPQIVSALIRVNLREIIFVRFADFNICFQLNLDFRRHACPPLEGV